MATSTPNTGCLTPARRTSTPTQKPTLILFNQKLSRSRQRLNEIPTTHQEKLIFLAKNKRSVQRLEELISECIEKGENRAQTQKTKDVIKTLTKLKYKASRLHKQFRDAHRECERAQTLVSTGS